MTEKEIKIMGAFSGKGKSRLDEVMTGTIYIMESNLRQIWVRCTERYKLQWERRGFSELLSYEFSGTDAEIADELLRKVTEDEMTSIVYNQCEHVYDYTFSLHCLKCGKASDEILEEEFE